MAKQVNRKMIGAFVVIAVAILAASIVIFGTGTFFKRKAEYVLYFNGSVKGLNVGSPVLFRGVQVGTVTRIVIRSYIKNLKTYIPVFVEVDPDKFEVIGENSELVGTPEERLRKLFKMGLRAQLVIQSMITGQLAIQVGMHPGTPISLHHLDKGYTEIPTIPSTMERLGKAFAKLNLQELETRLNNILDNADRLLNNPDIPASLHELRSLLQNAHGLVDNVNSKVDPLAANLNTTITDARGLVKNMDQQVKPLAGKATSTMDAIKALARNVDVKVDPLSKQISETMKSVEKAFNSVNGLVGQDSPTRTELDNSLQEISRAARSLRVLADYLEEHPDALIKGKGYKNY